MRAVQVVAFVVLTLVSGAIPLSAHHAWPVSYSQLVTVRGTVTTLTWANPHPMIIRLERVVLADGKEMRVYAP